MPPEDDEDYVDMGGAILTFYSSLVDLLGRCAPEAEAIKSGRSDSIRARAILRSLVSMEDLEGVLGLRFILPINQPPPTSEDGQYHEELYCVFKTRTDNDYHTLKIYIVWNLKLNFSSLESET